MRFLLLIGASVTIIVVAARRRTRNLIETIPERPLVPAWVYRSELSEDVLSDVYQVPVSFVERTTKRLRTMRPL